MGRIDNIHIYNFKFFDEQEPIKLGGKHLLLYGENGSGKSSIYWALYTLFEAALKKDKSDIQKYFRHPNNHDQSLINIHTQPIITGGSLFYDSFIKVETNHEPAEEYEISIQRTEIKDDLTAKEINLASDFISYKVLYKFQDFWNRENMNLADIFIGHVLPYIVFPEKDLIRDGVKKTYSNAADMFEELVIGPGTTTNGNGKIIQVYKSSPEYRLFEQFAQHFDDNIKDLIDFININAPSLLKKLGYDIDFSIEYKPFSFRKADVRYSFQPFELVFTISSYLGKSIRISRPQSFLNEAKITAIAIAIRLTILRKRVNEQAGDILKFIVFDDVMISLDMNNRDRLLDFILSDDSKLKDDYQLLFLTHDRSLFHYLKDKIRNLGLKDKWVYKEMYVGHENNIEVPNIYNFPNKLNKAEYYLQKNDFPACGIYLRVFCEEVLDRLYPSKSLYEIKKNSEGVYETKTQNLNDKIGHLEWFCEVEGLDYESFRDLKTYKSVILNSLAHNDVTSPLYRNELEKVYDVLCKLDKIERDILIAKTNSTFSIPLTKKDGKPYIVGVTIREPLRLLVAEDGTKRPSNFCRANITYLNDDGEEQKELQIEKNNIQEIVTEKCDELEIKPIDYVEIMLDREKNLFKEKFS